MIQRVQSVYLLLASVLCFGLLYFEMYRQSILLQLAATVLGLSDLLSIFLYKDRRMQILLGKLNILLSAVLLFGTIYAEMETELKVLGWPIGMILISVILLAIANQAIKKDEELVKSADRFR